MTTNKKSFDVPAPYYPILYSNGHAMTAIEREEISDDAYYGFAASSVKKYKQQKQIPTNLLIFSKASRIDTVKLRQP